MDKVELNKLANIRMQEIASLPWDELKDFLLELNEEASMDLYSNYIEANQKEIHEIIRLGNKFTQCLRQRVTTEQDMAIWETGSLSGKLGVYRKLLNLLMERSEVEYQIDQIIGLKYMKEIILALYRNSDMQYKSIKSEFSEYGTKQLEILVDIGCVKKKGHSKYTYYNLTDAGKNYVMTHFMSFIQEADYFASKDIVEGYVQEKEIILFNDENDGFNKDKFAQNDDLTYKWG